MKKLFLLLMALLTLTACGVDGTLVSASSSGSSSSGSSSSGSSSSGSSDNVKIGKKDGSTFTAGTIGTDLLNISAGGITSLYVSLVKGDGNLYTDPVTIEFTSDCLSSSKAKLQDNSTLTDGKSVTTNTGYVSVNYLATGCAGTDVVTAQSTISGALVTASVDITVAAAQAGSITFVSASPSSIALLGRSTSTMPDSSLLRFQVKDTNGNLIANKRVNFTLNTTLGGLTLVDSDPACDNCATSGNDGYVQIYVKAGNVATTVRITASIEGTSIATQSSNLVVTTGLPDQDSFSLALESGVNIEGYDIDGTQNLVTARLSDRTNNPVPDGTAIVFQAEGGSIESQCQTLAGKCSVTWTSSNPRPADGRVTILATAIGEESFNDVNGNGVFDMGDSFSDIAEPFRDDDEDGSHGTNEPFYDFNSDGNWNLPDSLFNGVCETGVCSAILKSAGIGQSAILIISGSRANITLSENLIDLRNQAVHSINLDIFDNNGNVMPAGTTVTITNTKGNVLSPKSFIVGSANVLTGQLSAGLTRFPIMIYMSGSPPPITDPPTVPTEDHGSLEVTVTTPEGVVTSRTFEVIDFK